MSVSFGSAWFDRDDAAEALLSARYCEAPARARRAAEAARPVDAALREAFAAANQGREDPSVDAALARLSEPVALVVTGQQLGLFLGPLYTLVKALAAVQWARRLEAECGRPVVPVFWLQTEDHDFEEVAQWAGPGDAARAGAGSRIRVALTEPPGEARTPIGSRALPPDIADAVRRLREDLPAGVDRARVLAWLESAYRPGATWTGAFSSLLSDVLRGQGILLFDPRHPHVSGAARPLFARAVDDHADIHAALTDRVRALESAGFAAQVPIRDEALPFVHRGGPHGPRHRPARGGTGWRLSGARELVEPARLATWLEREPERFSSSALLRPILQDFLLPVAAQIAGPGEVSYLAQCVPLWEHFSIEPCVVVPRPRVRLIEPWARRLAERWELDVTQVGPTVDATLRAMREPEGPNPDQVRDKLSKAWAELSSPASELGNDVAPARRVLDETVERALGRFCRKYERIRQRRDADRWAAARRLTDAFFPEGAPQERVDGAIPFLARYGSQHVVERIAAALEPETDSGVRDVEI